MTSEAVKTANPFLSWTGGPLTARAFSIYVMGLGAAIPLASREPTGLLQGCMYFVYLLVTLPAAWGLLWAADKGLESREREFAPVGGTVAGTAGASAQREYQRRRARSASRLRPMLPVAVPFVIFSSVITGTAVSEALPGWGPLVALGLVAVMVAKLLTQPGHVTAWRVGADGERRTAARVGAIEGRGFVTLNDRHVPGRRANIDHIVVGPTGIFVVETKSWSGKVAVRRGSLWVDGRRRDAAITQALQEADAVRSALTDLPGAAHLVRPVLCIHRASVPWGKLEVGGVRIVTGHRLPKLLSNDTARLSSAEVQQLVEVIDQRLPPA